jgi:hypothetical protein
MKTPDCQPACDGGFASSALLGRKLVRKMAQFVCKHCGIEFTKRADIKPQFCSRDCAAKGWDHSCALAAMHQKLRETNPNYGNAKRPRICKTCGNSFVQKFHHNPSYCSNKCLPQAAGFKEKKWETKRLAAYNESPKTKPLSETRHNVRRWHLRSPMNVVYHPINLNRFVTMNPALFEPDDVKPIYKDGRSRAVCSLKNLRPSDRKKKQTATWKGWTWVSIFERRFNDGRDLLERPNTDLSHTPPKAQ